MSICILYKFGPIMNSASRNILMNIVHLVNISAGYIPSSRIAAT